MVSLSNHASDALPPKPEMTPAERIAAFAAEHKLTIAATFVPFSRSRNAKPRDGAKEPWRSLNWTVTLQRDGRDVLTTDYAQGEAHAPAYKLKAASYRLAHYQEKTARHMAISHEIETGRVATWTFGELNRGVGKPIDPPSIVDILYSQSSDASVLDAGGFEGWADEFGYSTDSRSAEASYRLCLEHTLALRAAIGEHGMEALRTACEDY